MFSFLLPASSISLYTVTWKTWCRLPTADRLIDKRAATESNTRVKKTLGGFVYVEPCKCEPKNNTFFWWGGGDGCFDCRQCRWCGHQIAKQKFFHGRNEYSIFFSYLPILLFYSIFDTLFFDCNERIFRDLIGLIRWVNVCSSASPSLAVQFFSTPFVFLGMNCYTSLL